VARICYRHHPFFDQEVQILRTIRQSEPSVIIQLADDVRIAIPRWMLDAAFCATLPHEPSPRVSLQALMELRNLVDRQPLSAAPSR
jgi:hypothetical protein